MTLSQLHFLHPWYLLLLLVPILVWLWLWATTNQQQQSRFSQYADSHLLPHLLGEHRRNYRFGWRSFLYWCAIWTLIVTAIAGPRWDYEDVALFRPGSDILVLFDLSASMDVTDVVPSRLKRGRQELEDLLLQNRSSRIGIIAFASMAHIVAALTEDTQALRQLLPALTGDLSQIRGSRLTEALNRAEQMLLAQPQQSSRHLVVISDGEFGDDTALAKAQQLAQSGVRLHVLGVGTPGGGMITKGERIPVYDANGNFIISRYDEIGLQQLAAAGNGIYRHADYRDNDTQDIIDAIEQDSTALLLENQTMRIWHEQYQWLVALLLLLLIWQFRRHNNHDDNA